MNKPNLDSAARAFQLNMKAAKALGLNTENLVGFEIDFAPGQLPTVTARYMVRPEQMDALTAVIEPAK